MLLGQRNSAEKWVDRRLNSNFLFGARSLTAKGNRLEARVNRMKTDLRPGRLLLLAVVINCLQFGNPCLLIGVDILMGLLLIGNSVSILTVLMK